MLFFIIFIHNKSFIDCPNIIHKIIETIKIIIIYWPGRSRMENWPKNKTFQSNLGICTYVLFYKCLYKKTFFFLSQKILQVSKPHDPQTLRQCVRKQAASHP